MYVLTYVSVFLSLCTHVLRKSVFVYLCIFMYLIHVRADPNGLSLAGIAGSNPAGGMDVCLL